MGLYEDILMVNFLTEVAEIIRSTPVQYTHMVQGNGRLHPAADVEETLNLIAKNLEEKAKEYARKNFES